MTGEMIELRDVSRRFGATLALDGVSLEIADGSFTALLGPSGCGKSTTLRIIAGLDQPSSGEIRIGGREVSRLSAAERNIAMVFQSYALYPHMSVRGNIMLPLAMRNMNRLERLPLLDRLMPSARRKIADHAGQVREIADMLDIGALLDRKPGELSGGQKQRAAVARALVRDPVAFLLDEPLSNLDAKLRVQMRGELVELHRRTGRTFVYVTHDQAEAMSMSDRIAVMMDGRLAQVGAPREIYERPASTRVAAFIGDHPINLLTSDVSNGRLEPPFDAFAVDGAAPPAKVVVGLRPESLRPVATGPIGGQLVRTEYLGAQAIATVRLSDTIAMQAVLPTEEPLQQPADALRFDIDPRQAHLFDADTGQRLDATLVRRAPMATARSEGAGR